MSKYKDIGCTDCRFYRRSRCDALVVFDCRLGNECKFYKPEPQGKSDMFRAGTKCRANASELRALMRENHIKVVDIAAVLGLGPGSVSGRVNGNRNVYGDEIERICNILKIPDTEIHKYFTAIE